MEKSKGYSVMKIITTDRRTNLHIDTLDNLLEIQMEGPPLSRFSATEAVHLWWDDCRTTRSLWTRPRGIWIDGPGPEEGGQS